MKTLDKLDIKMLIDSRSIHSKIRELAEVINEEYKNEEVYVISVLKGAVMFTVDFIKFDKNCAVCPVSIISSITRTFLPFKSGRDISTALTLPLEVKPDP